MCPLFLSLYHPAASAVSLLAAMSNPAVFAGSAKRFHAADCSGQASWDNSLCEGFA